MIGKLTLCWTTVVVVLILVVTIVCFKVPTFMGVCVCVCIVASPLLASLSLDIAVYWLKRMLFLGLMLCSIWTKKFTVHCCFCWPSLSFEQVDIDNNNFYQCGRCTTTTICIFDTNSNSSSSISISRVLFVCFNICWPCTI